MFYYQMQLLTEVGLAVTAKPLTGCMLIAVVIQDVIVSGVDFGKLSVEVSL